MEEPAMKRYLCAIAALTMSAPTLGSEVGVSVNVAQPGFYGRVEIGNLPAPPLVYAQPIVVEPPPGRVSSPPIYLHVPPGHAKNWYKHCARYNACGQPVYFVQENWYNNVYVARNRGGEPVALVSPGYEYQQRPRERLYEVPVSSVRAVVGAPEQRCWVERQQVVEDRSDAANVPGAIAGAVIGGVLGHQIGSGRGRDVATAGGAVAGAAEHRCTARTCRSAPPFKHKRVRNIGRSLIISAAFRIACKRARLRDAASWSISMANREDNFAGLVDFTRPFEAVFFRRLRARWAFRFAYGVGKKCMPRHKDFLR
jgi:hypothetical protein